jgi:hypothetical protein
MVGCRILPPARPAENEVRFRFSRASGWPVSRDPARARREPHAYPCRDPSITPFLFQPPGNTGLAMSRSGREREREHRKGAPAASPSSPRRGPTGVLLPTPPDRQDIYSIHFHCPATATAPEPHPIHSETFAAGHRKTDCLQSLVWSQEHGSFARAEQCLNPHSIPHMFVSSTVTLVHAGDIICSGDHARVTRIYIPSTTSTRSKRTERLRVMVLRQKRGRDKRPLLRLTLLD